MWTIVDVVTDNDVSAAGRKARPGFERVLQAIESGAVDVVIAWALDRLTRNRRDTLRLIETCQQRSATIALVRGSDLDLSTPAGRLTADLLAAVARSEIETKSDRQIRAAQQAAEQGRWLGGRRPFGYEANGHTIREPEAQAVRDGYQWLLDGVSLRQIAQRWNEAGLHPPQGTRDGGRSSWSGTVVSRCLRKPRYAGLSSYRKEALGLAQWPALVDADTWHAAQAVLRNPVRVPTRGDQRMLSGIALCDVCGSTVNAGGGATGRGVYRCSGSSGHVIRKREPVDDLVERVVIERLSRPDARVLTRASPPGQAADLLAQSDALRQRLEGLSEAYADGTITIGQLRKGSERLRTALAELEGRLAALDNGPGAELRELVSADDVAAAWSVLSNDTRRGIIARLMTIRLKPPGRGVRILDPASIRIEWRLS